MRQQIERTGRHCRAPRSARRRTGQAALGTVRALANKKLGKLQAQRLRLQVAILKSRLPKLPHFCYIIAVTTYNRLFEEAIDNYGLVTTSMARKMGIEPGALVDLAYRGRLTRIGQGVYQLVQYAPGENDPYAQAVALVGDGSYLYGESVIAMLGLAPTDPDRIYVATAKRVRRNLGCGIQVVKINPEYQPIAIEGIPSQRIQDAIVCAKTTMPSERLRAACKEAFRIGKIDEKERKKIEHEI